ncbi:Uncharacterized protein conserved in bacteria, NMA0228-like [hydrothermal vent metagenome]|uniref:Uncharacterized protein conserved in bacteria, NMA0228-like n=1 Tax=hydrothermal vent metagenome TaxID=652676 RepID=A0A3B0ZWU8_9ZZZZ
MKEQQVVPLHTTISGVGVGLRANHFKYIDKNRPNIPWFEVLIDNYMMDAGSSLHYLAKAAEAYPLTFHGVGMSLGSTDKLNIGYLSTLKDLIKKFRPVYVSDHLCWTSVNGYHSHDLLPLPYTDEAVQLLIKHIQQTQDFLEQRILIENVSSYLTFKDSAMQEWEFLTVVAEEADCDILLDINNIYVSAANHNIDAMVYLKHIPVERVKEMHLAGYTDMGTHLLDTHGEAVHEPVWELYEKALNKFGGIPTLIEWDNDIPEFPVLEVEAIKASVIMQQVKEHAA